MPYAERETTPATTSNRRNKKQLMYFLLTLLVHENTNPSVDPIVPLTSQPTRNWLKRAWSHSTSTSPTNTSSHGHLVLKPCLHGANWLRTPTDRFACVKVQLPTCLPISNTTQTILGEFKRAVSHLTSANQAHIFHRRHFCPAPCPLTTIESSTPTDPHISQLTSEFLSHRNECRPRETKATEEERLRDAQMNRQTSVESE